MPPAMVPTACILCDSRSWASSSLRCASAFLRPVRSRANTVVVSPSAWRSNDTLTSTASSLPLAVNAVISPSRAWVVSWANASACAASGKKRSRVLPSASLALHWNSAAAEALRQREGPAHAPGVLRARKGHQRRERAVAFGGLERAVCHRVGLHHHVVFVHHHESQRHAGKQGLEAFIGAFRHGLAVAQDLVLALQLCLVGAQLSHQALGSCAGGRGTRGGCPGRVTCGSGLPPRRVQKRQVGFTHGSGAARGFGAKKVRALRNAGGQKAWPRVYACKPADPAGPGVSYTQRPG